MSSFVVSDLTMQDCVSALHPRNLSCENADKLGRDLWALNLQAYKARYPREDITADLEHYATWQSNLQMPVLDGHGLPWQNLPLSCQWLKSLCCLRYQCCEGNLSDTDLYRRLTEKINELAITIAQSLPEYETAKWDRS